MAKKSKAKKKSRWAAVWGWLDAKPGTRRRVVHRVQVSGQALEYVRGCSARDVRLFAGLVLRLDADPVSCSTAILTPGVTPGMRWARFGDHRVILQWNPVLDQVRIGLCEPA